MEFEFAENYNDGSIELLAGVATENWRSGGGKKK